MTDQHDDATRQFYFLAQLATDDDREWTSLHVTSEDAERKLRVVGEAWGVGFTLDGEPADGFRFYAIEHLPVLSTEESNEPPVEEVRIPITREEYGAWDWLVIRDVPGGLSADEMADDFGITNDVAALRLAGITVLGMAHEVSPGRYRCGEGDDTSQGDDFDG